MRHKAHMAAVVLFLLQMLTIPAWAGTFDFNPGQTGTRYKSDMQDDVEGHGYVMEYKKINTNNLSLLKYSHGSGSMDFADLLNSEQKTTTDGSIYYYWALDENGKWVKKANGGNSIISYTGQYDNKQSPTNFAYGTGWYATHPVTYNSLLKDKTDAKSYQEAITMERQVEYARGHKGDIAIDLNCTGPTDKASGKGTASMKIDDEVTQGTMHIGELVSHTLKSTAITVNKKSTYDSKIEGWRNPIIEVDLNYVGDFKVQKSMKLEISKAKATEYEDWLPCCYGDFFDIPSWNLNKERAGEVGIFDCTCRNTSLSTYKPAWNGTTAQFPESVYGSRP